MYFTYLILNLILPFRLLSFMYLLYGTLGFPVVSFGNKTDRLTINLFLAHLSRRLTGELIVYPCSGVRRPSSVVGRRRSQFQRSSPLKPLGQSKPIFMWSIIRKGERKFI